MASMEELREVRVQKLKELRRRGIDPYPAHVERTFSIADLKSRFDELAASGESVKVTGRIRAIRSHGVSTFFDTQDGSGQLQVFCEETKLGKDTYSLISELLDIGDFVEVTGTTFVTKQGAPTVNSSNLKIIEKALRPIPEEHFGLKDVEEKLRRRYLDLIVIEATRNLFVRKAQFWKSARSFLEEHSFIEVDTPALEDVPGGADARPFITHHNALDRDFYLRISLELPLKKIIIGGLERVYEIGKVFRNEGISPEHLQDYLLCEFYWAYADYNDLMGLLENMHRHIVEETTGGVTTMYDGREINWAGTWPRVDFYKIITDQLGQDLSGLDTQELRTYAKSLGIGAETQWEKGRILDYIWKKKVRPHILQPTFIIHHPIEVSPLAKRLPDEPSRVERVQLVAAGTELGNGWSELNDPLDQREGFKMQQQMREAGDEEAQMTDESYLEALEYGMPPTAGYGFSERLFSILMDRPVRETVVFPPMREEHD